MITVIGGSGFIGSYLCKALSNMNIPFEIVDLKESPLFPERTKIADVRDKEALRSAVAGEVVVHLAAVHRDDVRDRSQYYTTNVDGTRNICEIAAERQISRIVFTSSVAVYGFCPPNTDERGPINPFNDYGRSKFEAEGVLREWYDSNPEQRALTIVRPTVVFGEGNRGNVYNLMKQINSGRFLMVGSGKNRKSMAYVGNIVEFLRQMILRDRGFCLCNYVDKPDFDMNSLVSLVRGKVFGKREPGFRIPMWAGLAIGRMADFGAKMFGTTLPVSVIRVQKFSATTTYSSSVDIANSFTAPFLLCEGIERTLEADFLNPSEHDVEFFTE